MSQAKEERDRQLVNARRACLMLLPVVQPSETGIVFLSHAQHGELIADLINQFGRLDAKEQRQIKAGMKGKLHGKKGGRPAKKKTVKRK